MSCVAIVMVLALAGLSSATDPLTATVTGRLDSKELTHKDGHDTIAKGLAIAAFGSALIETDSSQERWEAARKTDHLRVQFDKPTKLTIVGGHGKSYSVDEILVKTTPWSKRPPLPTPNGQGYFIAGDTSHLGKGDGLVVRCGDKYYSFEKCQGMLMDPLITLFGPASIPKE